MKLAYEQTTLYSESEKIKEKLTLNKAYLEETLMSGTYLYDGIDVFVCDVDSDCVTIMSCCGSIFTESDSDVVMVDTECFLKLNRL